MREKPNLATATLDMGLRGLEMVESFVEKAGSVFLVKNMSRSDTSGWILFVLLWIFI